MTVSTNGDRRLALLLLLARKVVVLFLKVAVLIFLFQDLVLFSTVNEQSTPSSHTVEGNGAEVPCHPSRLSSSTPSPLQPTKLGVFVIKVVNAHDAVTSLCILDKFFNHGPQYPIRIFADRETTNSTLLELVSINPDVDLQVIVDKEERWNKLPTELSEFELHTIQPKCTKKSCTTHGVAQSYVYMGYWRYRLMAYEDSLKDFEYFISWDADAYLVQPMEIDPFNILQLHNLTGFIVNDMDNTGIAQGIDKVARRIFGSNITGRGYLNTPDTFPLFGDDGFNHRSFFGHCFGGRLDFFRSPEFREYSRLMVPFTYQYRVDEQVVIAMAWSMLAPDRVWHLPNRGYKLGVYHHSFLDDKQLVNCTISPPPDGATVHNYTTDLGLCYWINPILPGPDPLEFQYPGFFWNDWVEYSTLVRSFAPTTMDDPTTGFPSGIADCICRPGVDSPPNCDLADY